MRWFLLGLGLVFGAVNLNAGDAAAGTPSYPICASCHGPAGEGNPAMNSPKLAGQEEWYLVSQLSAFKTGIRGSASGDLNGAQMRGMAMTLADDNAVNNVAAYIGTFPQIASPVTVQGDAAKGQALYAVCAACHGPKGEGNAALKGPRLAGQNDWYLVNQLNLFKQGLRGTAPGDVGGAQMRPMAMILADDQAVLDVVSYINTLQ